MLRLGHRLLLSLQNLKGCMCNCTIFSLFNCDKRFWNSVLIVTSLIWIELILTNCPFTFIYPPFNFFPSSSRSAFVFFFSMCNIELFSWFTNLHHQIIYDFPNFSCCGCPCCAASCHSLGYGKEFIQL